MDIVAVKNSEQQGGRPRSGCLCQFQSRMRAGMASLRVGPGTPLAEYSLEIDLKYYRGIPGGLPLLVTVSAAGNGLGLAETVSVLSLTQRRTGSLQATRQSHISLDIIDMSRLHALQLSPQRSSD